MFGWSELPWASRFGCLACHVSHVVKEARDHWDGQDVCELPDLIRNSSLSVAKHKRAELPRDIEDAGTTSFFDGRWMCFAHHVQDGECVANLPEAFCSSNSNLSLAECVRMCDDTPECQMVVHNQPSHSDDNARGCWLKAELKMMRRDRASFNTHTCVQVSKRRSDPPHVLNQTQRSFCTDLVVPVDVSPVRSPQAVHDVLASELASARSSVLEIGARNGDSIHCFARFARAASVIEANPSYCRVLEEREILRAVHDHAFVVGMYGAFEDASCFHLVLEYAANGTLSQWLDNPLREEPARLLTAEMCAAIAHIHRHAVVYRDLKPENVLVHRSGHIMLADFGVSKRIVESTRQERTSLVGTVGYIAPEILRLEGRRRMAGQLAADAAPATAEGGNADGGDEGYSYAVDWWSLGVMVHLLMTGSEVFGLHTIYGLMEAPPERCLEVTRERVAEELMGAHACDLVMRLLEFVPALRLGGTGGASEVQAHAFFESIDWQALEQLALPPPLPTLGARATSAHD